MSDKDPRRLSEGMQKRIDERMSEQSMQDFLAMTVEELAGYARGAAEVGSTYHEFYKQLIAAKCARLVESELVGLTKATESLERSSTTSSEALNRTTSRLVWATWALVFSTVGLVVVAVVSLVAR